MAEPAIVAAAYTAETVVEGAAAAALVVKRPTMPLTANWRQVNGDVSIPRRLHTASLLKGKAYIFGGETEKHQPAGSDLHVFTLPTGDEAEEDYKKLTGDSDAAPAARSGHAAAVIADRIYIYGGQDPLSQKPLREDGSVWVYDSIINRWSRIEPMPKTPFPPERSRHAMCATEHPLPSAAAQQAGAAGVAPHGSLIISGGSGDGGVLSDCWCFDIGAAIWSQFPSPPEPAREAASMTLAGNRIYRFGGSDGSAAIGNQIDYLRIAKSTFDDKGGKSEAAVIPETDKWESIVAEEGEAVPGPRSGAGMHAITTGQGRNYIACIMGEKGAGTNGDNGKFWDDVWSYQTQPTGMTGASLKDAVRQLVGAKTAEGSWAKVDMPEFSKTEGSVAAPSPRGGFATAYDQSVEKLSILLWGGVGVNDEVLGDGWLLTIAT